MSLKEGLDSLTSLFLRQEETSQTDGSCRGTVKRANKRAPGMRARLCGHLALFLTRYSSTAPPQPQTPAVLPSFKSSQHPGRPSDFALFITMPFSCLQCWIFTAPVFFLPSYSALNRNRKTSERFLCGEVELVLLKRL